MYRKKKKKTFTALTSFLQSQKKYIFDGWRHTYLVQFLFTVNIHNLILVMSLVKYSIIWDKTA